MDFMTSTENLTAPAPECTACAPDPGALETFQRALRTLSGKWKLQILFRLMEGPMRFGALRRAVGGVTQHMLTAQLRELEQDGLVRRTAFAEVPPRVEYELADAAYGLLPTFRSLLAWSVQYRNHA
jgi:DNA-binding HxlR family transcriptional regulator